MQMNMGMVASAVGLDADEASQFMNFQSMGSKSNSSNMDSSLTNLIVNYIPTTLTDEDFVKLFSSIGPVKSCKIIRDKATHQSYGFGFCDYGRAEDAKRAIETLNGLQLQNKTLRVAYARPPENGDPLSTKANVYVQGLPRTVGQDELSQFFGQFGTIIQSKVLLEAASGESRGCGFVLFSRRAEAENAITQVNGKTWPGTSEFLQVRFALDPQQKKMKQTGGFGGQQFGGGYQYQQQGNSMQMYSGAGGPMRSGRQAPRSGPYARGPQFAQSEQQAFPSAGGQPYIVGAKPRPEEIGTTLYVYNIGPQCQEQTLYNLFAAYGSVTKIAVIRDPLRGCTKGYAFVTFHSYSDASNAVTALNGYTLWEKPLQVTFKQPKNQPGSSSMQAAGDQQLF